MIHFCPDRLFASTFLSARCKPVHCRDSRKKPAVAARVIPYEGMHSTQGEATDLAPRYRRRSLNTTLTELVLTRFGNNHIQVFFGGFLIPAIE
jgi:hypothetical protein